MIKIAPFCMGDLELFYPIETTDITPEAWNDLVGSLPLLVNDPDTDLLTIGDEDNIYALMGITYFGNHGEAWAVFSEGFYAHRFSIQKQILELLKSVEVNLEIDRISATVVEGFSEGIRWLESLGFIKNGPRPSEDPYGRTHIEYIRYAVREAS